MHLVTLLATLGLSSVALAQPAPLRYTLRAPEAAAHYLSVSLELTPLPGATETLLKLPVWTPGSYLVREYAKNLEGFRATSTAGQALTWEKTDKQTWRLRHPAGQPVQVTYRLYANEPSVRTSIVDADHAFVVPAATFLYVAGHQELPVEVSVELPPAWYRVSTALAPLPGRPLTWRAADLDELNDSPLELGNQQAFSFTASGTRHRVVMAGAGFRADTVRLKTDMARVCEQAVKVFGELPARPEYLFIVHHYTQGSGGLEHKFGSVLDVSRTTYDTPEAYRSFLELVAHEYFHLWNVKRLRPQALGPFDYDRENYTHMLWVAEGFTSYYEDLLVYRAGLTTREQYLQAASNQLTSVENQPGNRVQPVADASWDAWIKAYRSNDNSRNAEISYYPKGAVLAMVFDAQIVAFSEGRQHLDDALRFLYNRYYKELGRGYTDDEFRQAMTQFTGRNQDDFFARHIYGAEPVDWNAALAGVGYQAFNDAPQPPPLTLGATLTSAGRVKDVRRDSPAWTGGLNTGDEVVSVNNQPYTPPLGVAAPTLDVLLPAPGASAPVPVTLQIRRDNQPRTLTLTPVPATTVKYRLAPLPKSTKAQRRAGEVWLETSADAGRGTGR